MFLVLIATSTAHAAPLWANEAALECDTDTTHRATYVIETGVAPGCPVAGLASTPLAPLTPADLIQNPTFANYYASQGFDANFLTWAPSVTNYPANAAEWAGCGAAKNATVAPHPGALCPGGVVHFTQVDQDVSNGMISALAWGAAFIGLGCGNFSQQTPDLPSPVPTISGTKFDDRNGNGTRDPGEAGLGGVTINLFKDGNFEESTTTDSNGDYSFALNVDTDPSLGPGTYTLTENVPAGYHQTAAPGPIVVNYSIGSQAFTGNDFGNAKAQPTISTTPSASVPVGFEVSDSATLSGGASPSGAVTFTLYGPGDTSCTTAVASASGTLSGGTANSGAIPVGDPPGTYRWVASYPGDGSNYPVASPCGSETVVVVPSADVSLTKAAAPATPPGCTPAQGAQPCVLHGQNVDYTLTESNAGPDTAAAPTITDTLPAGQTFASSDDACTASGAPVVVVCPTPDLPKGATGTVHIVASTTGIPALSAALLQVNHAVEQSATFDVNTANNSAQASITVVPVADLSLAKSAAPVTPPGCSPAQGTQPCVLHGQNVTYTLTESDAGPDPATTPAITDTLPAGQTLASSDDGCTGSGTPVVVACPTATLPNGSSDTIHLVASTAGIPAPLNAPLLQTDNAVVASTTFDPATANNAATAGITVVPAADLALTKTSAPNPVIAGQQLTYTLTATNNGPDTAVNTIITDTLPPAETLETEGVVEIVRNTIGGAIDVANNHPSTPSSGLGGLLCTSAISSGLTTVTCPAGNVVSGASVFAKIVVVPSVGMPVNTGVVGSDTADPNLANNTASNTTTVTSNCTVNQTGITNSAIIVPTGEFLCLDNATVAGSIIVHAGAGLTETNSTTGPVDANSPVFVTVCGSKVNGAIAVTDASEIVRIGDGPVLCAPNAISGAVDATGNMGGYGGPAVVANHVQGSIDCTDDTPVTTDQGQPNTSGGPKLHECSAF